MNVFRNKRDGGPVHFAGSQLPIWNGKKLGTDPNETARQMIHSMDEQQKRRFEYFMSQINSSENMTPWKRDWLDKTTGGHQRTGYDIQKCKLELVRRLLIMQITGPTSLEDWVLFFLYYDNSLDLPPNIEQMLKPTHNLVTPEEYIDTTRPKVQGPGEDYWFQLPRNMRYTDLNMPGISGDDRRDPNNRPRYQLSTEEASRQRSTNNTNYRRLHRYPFSTRPRA